MREILKVLAYFNWFTPLEIVTRRVFEGRSYSFKVHESCGWSGARIVNMLRQKGVKTTGHMFVNDHYMFHVPIQQARLAQYLMDRAGIPVANPMTARQHQYPIRGDVRPMRGAWKRKC